MLIACIVLLCLTIISLIVLFLYVRWEFKNNRGPENIQSEEKIQKIIDGNQQFSASAKDLINTVTEHFAKVQQILSTGIENNEKSSKSITEQLSKISADTAKELSEWKETFTGKLTESDKTLTATLTTLNKSLTETQTQIKDENVKKFNEITKDISDQLKTGIGDINKKVDTELTAINNQFKEKFEKDLQDKLNTHFNTINTQMENLTSGLTKFETIQKSVTELNNTFSNAKRFGTVGEINLENILTEVLGFSLFEKQYALDTSSTEKVDFAVRVFDKRGEPLFLPIDCKFNLDLYRNYLENPSTDSFNKIKSQITSQAKDISKKYIISGKTLDYALMYLPAEGLYGLLYSDEKLINKIWNESRVIPVGPSTIIAVLSNVKLIRQQVDISKSAAKIVDAVLSINKTYENLFKKLDAARKSSESSTDSINKAIKHAEAINKKISKFSNSNYLKDFQKNQDDDDDLVLKSPVTSSDDD